MTPLTLYQFDYCGRKYRYISHRIDYLALEVQSGNFYSITANNEWNIFSRKFNHSN